MQHTVFGGFFVFSFCLSIKNRPRTAAGNPCFRSRFVGAAALNAARKSVLFCTQIRAACVA